MFTILLAVLLIVFILTTLSALQVRDLMVYLEGNRLAEQSNEIRDGAVVAVGGPSKSSNGSLKPKGGRRKK